MAKAKIRREDTDISLQHGSNVVLLRKKAKKTPDDEYYTLYEHVDAILRPCIEKHALDGKRVYCNCDTKESNFYKWLKDHFDELGLSLLIATGYNMNGDHGTYIEYDGQEEWEHELNGKGSWDSEECMYTLMNSDVVITNPPFSMARVFFKAMLESGKQFILLLPKTVINPKIASFMKNRAFYLLYDKSKDRWYLRPDGSLVAMNATMTFSNIPEIRPERPKTPTVKFDPAIHKPYDNGEGYNCRTKHEIPDIDEPIGVPISFYCVDDYETFDILGFVMKPLIDGRSTFIRMKIQKRQHAQV